jgi:predicted aspartyl protease
MICPKCGFDQPDDIYCVFCGVNIEKYRNQKKKRRRKSLVLGILIVLVVLSAAAYLFYPRVESLDQIADRPDPRLARRTDRALPAPQSRESRPEGRVENAGEMGSGRESRSSADFPQVSDLEKRQEKALERDVSSFAPEGEDGERRALGDEEEIDTASEWFQKGLALDDDSDAEMECYEKAITLDPEFAPAYYRLGAFYYRHAKYELADQHFAKFVKYASEADREAYDIYVYYSLSDMERLSAALEEEAAAERDEEKAPSETGGDVESETEPTGDEEGGEEASDEVMTVVRFSTVNGHVMVPVVLNDRFQATVMVDTGSGITILSEPLATEIGLTGQANHPITLKTIGKDVRGRLATLNSIQIGRFRRASFPVAVADLSLGEEGRFDGILGMDFMNSFIIHINNEEQEITLTTRVE